jgi:hypothetical protein
MNRRMLSIVLDLLIFLVLGPIDGKWSDLAPLFSAIANCRRPPDFGSLWMALDDNGSFGIVSTCCKTQQFPNKSGSSENLRSTHCY